MPDYLDILGLIVTAILFGTMTFFSFVVAPVAFIKLDVAAAGRFIRSIFPWYYLPSRRHSSAMVSSPRRPSSTMRIFSSAEYCLRVARRMSLMVLSAAVCRACDFCLICVPFGHYDEPEILPYANLLSCPIGADVRQ